MGWPRKRDLVESGARTGVRFVLRGTRPAGQTAAPAQRCNVLLRDRFPGKAEPLCQQRGDHGLMTGVPRHSVRAPGPKARGRARGRGSLDRAQAAEVRGVRQGLREACRAVQPRLRGQERGEGRISKRKAGEAREQTVQGRHRGARAPRQRVLPKNPGAKKLLQRGSVGKYLIKARSRSKEQNGPQGQVTETANPVPSGHRKDEHRQFRAQPANLIAREVKCQRTWDIFAHG